MEGISNQAGQEKNPYLTAGDKTYIIGTQDGNFPDLGGHTPGEMGAVWNHLIKLLDGFWVKMTDNKGNSCWLENAIQYTNYPFGSKFEFAAIASISAASAKVTTSAPRPSITARACLPEPPCDCLKLISWPVVFFQYAANSLL